MTKVLVFSDTHGDDAQMEYVINSYKKEVDLIVHCGDLEYPVKELTDRTPCPVYIARGNCDYGFSGEEEPLFEIDNHICLVTHGHRHGVNWGLGELADYANEVGADVVFYGHTHVPDYQEFEEQGVTIMNPGSLTRPRTMNFQRTFMIVDFLDDGTIDPHFYVI